MKNRDIVVVGIQPGILKSEAIAKILHGKCRKTTGFSM